jgi:hypothetical protein
MSADVSPERASGSTTERPRRSTAVVVVVVLALLLTFTMFVLAFLGITERETYAFARRYGTAVEVSLPGTCAVVTNMQRGLAWKDCVATWSVDGDEVEGKLLAGTQDELIEPVEAFAVGRRAITEGYHATGRSNPQLGLLSAWLFLPFPLTVVVLIVVSARRRKRAATPPA